MCPHVLQALAVADCVLVLARAVRARCVTLNAPGATDIYALEIDGGSIVGSYYDGIGVTLYGVDARVFRDFLRPTGVTRPESED